MRRTRNLCLVLVILAGGCASAGSGGQPSERNRITPAQLERSTATNAYDAVRLLHPEWLDTRGANSFNTPPSKAVLYLDGNKVGDDLDQMRTIPVGVLVEIRFLTAAEAANRYGLGISRGVIEITTRKR